MTDLNGCAEPSEITTAIAFPASEECTFITGAKMTVDGAASAIHKGFRFTPSVLRFPGKHPERRPCHAALPRVQWLPADT